MNKERRVAIDAASLSGGEISYLKYLPLAIRVGIAKSAGASVHLPPGTPANFDHLFLNDDSLGSISSLEFTPGKNLFVARNAVGLVLGARKRKYGEVNIKQVPVVLPSGVLDKIAEERPKNFRSYKILALEYFKNRLIKATPEVFAKYNIRTQEDLDKLLKDHNAAGFCFDTTESKFLEGNLLFDWVIRRTILVKVNVFKDDSVSPQPKNIAVQEVSKPIRDTKLAGFEGTYVLSFDPLKFPGICGYVPYPTDVINAIKPLVDAVNIQT